MKYLSSLQKKISRFFKAEEGASAIEYAVIAGFIAIAILLGAGKVATGVNEAFGRIETTLNTIAAPPVVPGS